MVSSLTFLNLWTSFHPATLTCMSFRDTEEHSASFKTVDCTQLLILKMLHYLPGTVSSLF